MRVRVLDVIRLEIGAERTVQNIDELVERARLT